MQKARIDGYTLSQVSTGNSEGDARWCAPPGDLTGTRNLDRHIKCIDSVLCW